MAWGIPPWEVAGGGGSKLKWILRWNVYQTQKRKGEEFAAKRKLKTKPGKGKPLK